ncbi:MAG: hypothetical protein HYU52_13230 [Acidobacteria bacterium]|nr:hypothetical protein [Acidobacteriota bacterium]
MNPPTDTACDRARTLLEAGADVTQELAAELVAEVESLRDQLSLSTTFEQAYVDEIQRMNVLVQELAEYVETIADAMADSLGSDEIPAQLKRQVVRLILQSSKAMRTSEKQ